MQWQRVRLLYWHQIEASGRQLILRICDRRLPVSQALAGAETVIHGIVNGRFP